MKTQKIKFILPVLFAVLFFFSNRLPAQSPVSKVRGAVTTTVPTEAISDASKITPNNSVSTVQYRDGFGRFHISVAKRVTPSGKDLVSMTSYDVEGEVAESWLPVPIASREDIPAGSAMMSTARSFYGDTHPYNSYKTDHDAVYIRYQTPAGKDWHNNGKQSSTTLLMNVKQGSEPLSCVASHYILSGTGVKLSGYYPANSLYAYYSIDEDGKDRVTFADCDGKLILERKVYDRSRNVFYDTYYVYDEKGLLRYVLPPEAVARMTSTTAVYTSQGPNTANNSVDQYCYIYQYDTKNRCIKKKAPGADWVYYVYDQTGHPVMAQDGNQREKNEWSFTIYDLYDRVIQEGTVKSTSSHNTLQVRYATQTIRETWTSSGYSNNQTFGGTDKVITLTNYYDTYDFINLPVYSSIKSNLTYARYTGYGEKAVRMENGVDISTRGILTGTATNLLDKSATITEAYYYDDKGRIVQSRSNNHAGGYSRSWYRYNYDNTVAEERKTQSHPSDLIARTLIYAYRYDAGGRLIATEQSIAGAPDFKTLIDSLQYDELGRVKRKLLHKGSYPINYAYNIRGQLKSITSPSFSQTLSYQDGSGNKYYNGNISSITESMSTKGMGVLPFSYSTSMTPSTGLAVPMFQ